MIFTAYFDEADTHGPAPTVVLAAHVGHAYQWRRFETKLGRLQRQYGFKIFHAKDFKARAGEFSGWHPDKCQRLLNDLTFLIRSTLTEGIAFSLERDVYLKEYRASPIPKKMNLDSQLGVCFRACLRRLLDIMEQRQYRDRLNIVMEHGHPNVGNCSDIFFDLQKRLQRIGHNFLGTFTIERKENCEPLMVSDFLAAVYSRIGAQAAATGVHYAETAPAPAKKEAALTILRLRPDALKKLKSGFEEMRRLEMAEWRAKRDAKKASSSGGDGDGDPG